MLHLPERLQTPRLVLRGWRPQDAPLLKAAIDGSLEHLRPWMPWAIAEPSPLPAVEERLAGFAARHRNGEDGIYGIFPPDEREVLGGIGIHPKSAAHVELGYWLRADVTGKGYATEAARAALAVACSQPGIAWVEIRCDPHNARSAAVPRRLGFAHAETLTANTVTPDGRPRDTMVWRYPVGDPR